MYARGLSTRDIEVAFRDESGSSMLSRSAVSAVSERLWADYQALLEYARRRELARMKQELEWCVQELRAQLRLASDASIPSSVRAQFASVRSIDTPSFRRAKGLSAALEAMVSSRS